MNFGSRFSLRRLSRAALEMLAAHAPSPTDLPHPETLGSVTALPPAHSPLFDTARQLLVDGYDRSSAIRTLQAQYPALTVSQADSMLREVACLLHYSGELHCPEVA